MSKAYRITVQLVGETVGIVELELDQVSADPTPFAVITQWKVEEIRREAELPMYDGEPPAGSMNTITLSRGATGWNAGFTGPHASHIVDLFGSAIIPTGFTSQAEPNVVRRAIENKNPGCVVLVS